MAKDTRTGSRHAGTPISIRLDDEQVARLERLAKKHGGKKGAFIAGLVALDAGREPSNEELLSMLRRRLK